MEKYPWRTTLLATGTLMGGGDLIAQTAVEKKSLQQLEWRRTARFFVNGVIFMGPLTKTWYVVLEKIVIKSPFKAAVPMQKMLIDQILFAPVCTAAFMSYIALLKTKNTSDTLEILKKDYLTVMRNCYTFWPFVQIANFYLIPLHHRVPFAQFFALIWNTYLATKTNRNDETINDETPE